MNAQRRSSRLVRHPPHLQILEARALPSFLPPVSYPTGNLPNCVAVGDFNGDGTADLAVGTSTNVSVLLGNGDGTFQDAVSYPTGNRPYAVAVGDFLGNGILDLAVANGGDTGDDTVSVLLGNGDGTFQTAVSYPAGASPKSVAVGDFNGDGILDLVVADENDNAVRVLPGNGDGKFGPATAYPAGSTPRSVAVGDFNGDGQLDLAVADNLGYGVSVLLGNGDGTFGPPTFDDLDVYTQTVTAADLNGDGQPDLLAGTVSGVDVLLGQGDGTFQPSTRYPGGTAYALAVADYNGDGIADFAAATGGPVKVYLGNGNGTFRDPLAFDAGPQARFVAAGDFNGDGAPDLVAANLTTPGTVSVLLNATDWTASPPALTAPAVAVPQASAGTPSRSAAPAEQNVACLTADPPVFSAFPARLMPRKMGPVDAGIVAAFDAGLWDWQSAWGVEGSP